MMNTFHLSPVLVGEVIVTSCGNIASYFMKHIEAVLNFLPICSKLIFTSVFIVCLIENLPSLNHFFGIFSTFLSKFSKYCLNLKFEKIVPRVVS